MIESEREYLHSKKVAERYRIARDELIRAPAEMRNRIDEATIAGIEGQLLRLYEDIRDYERLHVECLNR